MNLDKLQDPCEPVKGKTLILNHCSGNIGHWLHDWYYSFFCDAIAMKNKFDHFAITGVKKDFFKRNHVNTAIDCLPCEVHDKLLFYEKGYTSLNCIKSFEKTGTRVRSDINLKNAFLPSKRVIDRTLSKRVNGKTLLSAAVKNFKQNNKYIYNQKEVRRVFIFQHDGTSGSHTGRRILNIDELIDSLRVNGLEVTVASQDFWESFSSPKEARSNFLSHDIFIGCYGAWMTDILFAKTGSKIILLYPEGFYSSWWMTPKNKKTYDWSHQYIHNKELGNSWINLKCESDRMKDIKKSSVYIKSNEVLKLSL